jgi:hypothetical protein
MRTYKMTTRRELLIGAGAASGAFSAGLLIPDGALAPNSVVLHGTWDMDTDSRPWSPFEDTGRPPNWPLQSFDAADWAKEFNHMLERRGKPQMPEGLLIAWFANALMRGYDEHAQRARNNGAVGRV